MDARIKCNYKMNFTPKANDIAYYQASLAIILISVIILLSKDRHSLAKNCYYQEQLSPVQLFISWRNVSSEHESGSEKCAKVKSKLTLCDCACE